MQVKSDRRLRREPSGAACAADPGQLSRYAAWFHELDAWTENWDIFHPETEGRYFFGNGRDQEGLLSAFMPRHSWPAPFTAWMAVAL